MNRTHGNYGSVIVLSVALTMLAGCMTSVPRPQADKAEFLNSPQVQALDRPFSEAVRAGDLLILSGQVGSDDTTGKVVPGGIGPESRQALRHVKSVLESNGATLADVVKCSVFLADIAEWGDFNTIYREFFKKPYPARSALGASGLALGARVEIECIAYVPQAKRR
ncbi:MAG TPA: Rid family hydrolase [Steroidobacteraceae bacterium]